MTTKTKPTVINYITPFIMMAIGAGHYIRHGLDLVTIIPFVLGVFSLYLVLYNHDLLQQVLSLIMKIWRPMGQLITTTLFIITFFLIFMPVGLILRLFKKDLLKRDWQSTMPSYWIDRPAKESYDYTRQF